MTDASYQHYLIGILAVANNIPAIAPYLLLTAPLEKKQINKLVWLITGSSFLIMLMAATIGIQVLGFFGISISAFQIAGGLLLCGTGIGMLNAKNTDEITEKRVNPQTLDFSRIVGTAIVPIAIPLTTGAGTISTITVFAETANRTHTLLPLYLAIITMATIIYLSFFFVTKISKVLGTIGMSVMSKLMGLVTLAIGVQFIVEGTTTILKNIL